MQPPNDDLALLVSTGSTTSASRVEIAARTKAPSAASRTGNGILIWGAKTAMATSAAPMSARITPNQPKNPCQALPLALSVSAERFTASRMADEQVPEKSTDAV